MTITEAFGDVADIIAQMNPDKIIPLKASKSMSDRVEELVSKKKEGLISVEESNELERLLGLDLFISLAKARARFLIKAAWGGLFLKGHVVWSQVVPKTDVNIAVYIKKTWFIAFEIDHIVSLKHGGGNEYDNLAYACPHCNQHKGSDLTTFLESYDDIVVLFNPRKQDWSEHFEAIDGEILPLTRIGQASVKIFRFNEPDLIILRRILTEVGRYP